MNEADILNAAIEMEEEGIIFYGKQAKEAHNQYARLFFERMIGEEEEHRNILDNALASITSETKVEVELGELPDAHVFPEDAEPIAGGYVDALSFAVELEENGLEYYIEASEKTSNESLKRIYDYLIDFEKAHVDRLRQEIEYIQNTPGNSEL